MTSNKKPQKYVYLFGEVEEVLAPEVFDPDPEQALAYLSDAENLWYPRLLRYARNSTVKEEWAGDSELNALWSLLSSQELRSQLEQVGTVSSISRNDLAGMQPDKRDALVQLSKSIHRTAEDSACSGN